MIERKLYLTDVSDEDWSFAAPYLTLMNEAAPQRRNDLREMVNALRWMARAGAAWRMLPTSFPRWELTYQQTHRWLSAGSFEAMVNGLRLVLRIAERRQGQPGAVIPDGRTLQPTCESGPRAGYDGYKRKRSSKVHMALDTPGHLLAVHATPANEQERAHVQALAQEGLVVTGQTVKQAFAGQGYTGEEPAQAARGKGIELQVIRLPEAKKGFVLLPRRRVVELASAGSIAFAGWRAITKDCPKRSPPLHFVVFAILMPVHPAPIIKSA